MDRSVLILFCTSSFAFANSGWLSSTFLEVETEAELPKSSNVILASTKYKSYIILQNFDWNLIEAKNRLYFRTTEDTNKNGDFDKDDTVFYYFVDLMHKELKLNEYKPFH